MHINKKETVKEVLLLPIICTKKEKKIYRDGTNIIHTGQRYCRRADEDMSDFAVKFYEIVYKDILIAQGGSLLDDRGRILNCNFAGDTINSFNSIANIVPGVGKSQKQRRPYAEWPNFLKEYYYKYHCLANFWILPMRIGRRSMKLNKYDSVDIFLNRLKGDYNILRQDTDYVKYIKDDIAFVEKHFVGNSYNPLSNEEIKEFYRSKDDKKPDNGKKLIEHANNFIECRAEAISADDVLCGKLYDLFKREEIIK